MNRAPTKAESDAWQAANGKACDEAFALRLHAAALDLRNARAEAAQAQEQQQETQPHE